MFSKLKPDFFLKHYTQIDVKWMHENGFKTILSDLDDTLVEHNKPFDEQFSNWYKSLENNGFALIVVSNNTKSRVEDFVTPFSIVGYGKCRKPGTAKIEKNLFYKGLDPDTTLFLGDQILTDMWCASRLRIKKALVEPIRKKETNWFMKFKRCIEKWILCHWEIQSN